VVGGREKTTNREGKGEREENGGLICKLGEVWHQKGTAHSEEERKISQQGRRDSQSGGEKRPTQTGVRKNPGGGEKRQRFSLGGSEDL